MTVNNNKKWHLHYGWWLVVICLLVLSIGTGTSLYLYSIIAGQLEHAFPGGRLLMMMGATVFFLTAGLMSPRVGILVDRYSIKWVLIAGSVIMGLGFILISLSTSIWQVIVCYALFIGAGMATLSSLTVSALLSRWFDKNRGLAMGIAGLGTQFGGLIYPPVMANLIDLYDWRIAMAVLGVFIILATPLLVYFTVRDYPPATDNDQSDGDLAQSTPSQDSIIPAPKAVQVSLRFLYTQRNIVLLMLAIGCASVVNVAVIANLSLFATDVGESVERGAYMISLLSVVGMVSSPLVGRFCDIWDIQKVSMAMFLLSACAGLVFVFANHYWLLLLGAFLQGVVGGSILPVWVSMLARVCDNRIYGQAMGATILVVYSMIALAPVIAGWSHDVTGDYRLLFLLIVVVMVIATLCTALMRFPASGYDMAGSELFENTRPQSNVYG